MSDLYEGGSSHHISLTVDGTEYPFMIYPDIGGWRKVDISDFAPKVAAGAMGYGDLSLWQTWAQEDWRHGFGFPFFTDEAGYAKTGQGVDTRHKGIAMLATDITSSETGHSVVKFVDFSSKVYALKDGNGGLRVYSGGSWAATGETTGTCYDGLSTGTYLLVALDGAAARMRKFDGTTWSNVGVDGNPPYDMKVLALHGGYIWAAEDGNNYLHYATENDVSDMEGDGESDAGVIIVGPGDIPIVNMLSYGGQLYVAREDGLWIIDDNDAARQLVNFSTERHANNFKTMAVWQGHMYFSIRHKLYRYTGSTFMDVTPNRYDEVFPYKSYGDFDDLTPRGRFLYCTARNTETTYDETLLCYDGVGWHKLWDVVQDAYVINCMNLSTVNDYLWLNYTESATTTAYIELQSLSDLPAAAFETSGNHYMYSSIFHAGFIDVDKTFRSIRVWTNNCSATQTIAVDFAIDGNIDSDTWTSIGEINTSPFQAIDFPDCVTNTTYGKKIQLRFNFATAAAAQSPILEAFAVKYMLRPDAVWGWQVSIIIADQIRGLKEQVMHDFTAEEQITALEAARDAKCPSTLTDPWGDDYPVFVSAVKQIGAEWKHGGQEEIECIYQVSFADATDC
jgi:hypothetical protein